MNPSRDCELCLSVISLFTFYLSMIKIRFSILSYTETESVTQSFSSMGKFGK